MTSEQRTRIRKEIDREARARITPRDGCAGCGTNHDNFTAGCPTCTNRKLLRRRRVQGLNSRIMETNP